MGFREFVFFDGVVEKASDFFDGVVQSCLRAPVGSVVGQERIEIDGGVVENHARNVRDFAGVDLKADVRSFFAVGFVVPNERGAVAGCQNEDEFGFFPDIFFFGVDDRAAGDFVAVGVKFYVGKFEPAEYGFNVFEVEKPYEDETFGGGHFEDGFGNGAKEHFYRVGVELAFGAGEHQIAEVVAFFGNSFHNRFLSSDYSTFLRKIIARILIFVVFFY